MQDDAPEHGCPLCARIEDGDELAAAFDDHYPVAPGHRLVIPRRHVARLEELRNDEWQAVFDRVHAEASRLAATSDVEGINIGVNSGAAAGQTVDHAHVHVIPRRAGDVSNPRGGIRWVLPDRADYWSQQ